MASLFARGADDRNAIVLNQEWRACVQVISSLLLALADGMHVRAEDIVITSGALEAAQLCLQSVTVPGDAVLVDADSSFSARHALEYAGLRPIEIPLDAQGEIAFDVLEERIQRHSPKACRVTTSFRSPLKWAQSGRAKQSLLGVLARYDIPLIELDVYGELYFREKRPASWKSFDSQGRVLHCSCFSKCLAPGYRIGWAVMGRSAPDAERRKRYAMVAASAPTQGALAEYLAKGGYEKHLRRLRKMLALQQNAMREAIARYFPCSVRTTTPAGGYFLWLKLPTRIDLLALYDDALRLGISLAPAMSLSVGHRLGDRIRLNYGYPWDKRMETAIANLSKLVQNALAEHRHREYGCV